VVLRGRRLDRRNATRASGLLNLPGRRRAGLFRPQKPLTPGLSPAQASHPDAGLHPQLTAELEAPRTGESPAPMVTLPRQREGARMYETPILHRAVFLISDAIVLTLASPFLAVWWIVRAVRKRFSV
jgi:hypothetical protein